jgi:hypothetical protein
MLIAIIGFTFLIILIFFFISEINSSKKNTTQNNTHTNCDPLRPQNKVINAIRSIWSNDFFLFDFKNILIELSIDEKSINNLTVFKFRNTESIEYKHWQLINSEDFIYPKIIDEITNKLSLSHSFILIKKEYDFLEEDVKYFFKLIIMHITLSDFCILSQKWIYRTVPKTTNEVEPDIYNSIFKKTCSN